MVGSAVGEGLDRHRRLAAPDVTKLLPSQMNRFGTSCAR
jgi:hypothetical protein